MTTLVLASKSEARRAMLEGAGITVDLVPAEIDERSLDAKWAAEGLSPAQIARLLADEKATAVSRARPDAYVIGADQTLALGQSRFSKPGSLAEARAHLEAFRGRIHHLHSGVALAHGGQIVASTVSSAAMHVRAFSDTFLDRYMTAMGDRVLTSVGCYQFESVGIQLFDRVEGDYFTILGMPLLPLLAMLRKEGLATP